MLTLWFNPLTPMACTVICELMGVPATRVGALSTENTQKWGSLPHRPALPQLEGRWGEAHGYRRHEEGPCKNHFCISVDLLMASKTGHYKGQWSAVQQTVGFPMPNSVMLRPDHHSLSTEEARRQRHDYAVSAVWLTSFPQLTSGGRNI